MNHWRQWLDVLGQYDITDFTTFTPMGTGKNNDLIGIQTQQGDYFVKRYSSLSYNDPKNITYELQVLEHPSNRTLNK